MKFLSLLLVLVLFVAILYQSVFSPAISKHAPSKSQPSTSQALETLKQAQELKLNINSKLETTNQKFQDMNDNK